MSWAQDAAEAFIRGDRSGRLSQLVALVPGALLYGLALLPRAGPRDAAVRAVGAKLFDDVVKGRRLDRLLDDAFLGCVDARRTAGPPPPGAWIWQRAVRADAMDPRAMRLAHRQLVRRALQRVEPTWLYWPGPVAFAPEEIPREPWGNATWYEAMATAGVACDRRAAFAEAPRLGLEAFLSRHALALLALTREAPGGYVRERWLAAIERVVDYVALTDRLLSRSSSPTRVLEDCVALRNTAQPAVMVRPLLTTEDLVAEARAMRHCLAWCDLAPAPTRRRYFAATVRCKRLTVMLETERSGTVLSAHIRGRCNRAPRDAELRALAPWLAAMGVGAPAGDTADAEARSADPQGPPDGRFPQ